MAFFRNDAVNRVNVHTTVQALAQGAGGVFFLVILLRAGITVPTALVAQAAILAGRFVLRPAVLVLAMRFGLKPLLIGGTLVTALQYPALAEVDSVGSGLLVLCVVASIGEVLYWISYNAYFSTIGDAEHRGHQIGVREALVAVANIGAPVLGAWSLLEIGPHWTLGAVGLVQALAVLPLLGIPNVAVKRKAPGAYRAARAGAIIILTDGWFDACYIFLWQIALYQSLGNSVSAYGGAMALAGLAGAVAGLVLGRHIDAGHGRRAVAIGYGLGAALIVFRAASLGVPWLAILANALGALLMPVMIPSLGTVIYNLAKSSPCPFRFHMATEGAWDVGCVMVCLATAALHANGIPLAVAMLLALPALGAAVLLLLPYFPRKGMAPD